MANIRAGVQAPIIDPDRVPTIREFSETETNMLVEPSLKTKGKSSTNGKARALASISNHQEDVDSLESRFYVRKRVIIGNYARRLDNNLSEDEASSKEIPTHEWRLFLRPFDPHDVSSSINTLS